MTFLEKIAVALMVGSWVVTAGILLVPFVDMEYNRVAVAAGIYVFTQVMYWTGFAIGGRELARRYRRGSRGCRGYPGSGKRTESSLARNG